jgi:CBS domain-containing protein
MQRTVGRLLEEKTSVVWTVAPDASVYEALEIMADKGIGALVVVDGDALAGIMSERDYARKIILLDRGSRETQVAEIMTSDVLTVTPDQTMGECMALMTDRRIRHLPVVVDGKLAGLVSIGDVVRSVIDEQRFMIEQLEGYITG